MPAWLLAARPKTLPAALVPVWVGSLLAWTLAGTWSPMLAACALGGALALQIAANFFNDALDYQKGADTAARLGPTRVTASGLLSCRAVLGLGVATLAVACAFALPLIAARGWPILAIGLPSLYFAFGYTGGPWPLAYRGLGELFVMLFFGLVAVTGTVFVNTGQWFWMESLLLGIQVGALSTVLIAINNLRDVEEDARTGKRTLAVRGGVRFARWEITLLLAVVVAGSVGWFAAQGGQLRGPFTGMVLASLISAVTGAFLAVCVWRTPPSVAYNKFLALAGAQLLLFAAVATVGTLILR